MATSTEAPAGRGATPTWGGDRLPVAPRQRRPGLAILAVVLILGGGLFSAALVLRSGAKQNVVLVTHDVQQGQQFVRADFKQVQVAPGDAPVIGWSRVGLLVGKTATTDIKGGTLIHVGLVGNDPLPRAGFVLAQAALKAGNVPRLSRGDDVRVTWTPKEGLDRGDAPQIPQTAIIIDTATVVAVSNVRSDGTVLLTLNIPEARETDFTRWAYLQSISVVKLHQGG
jgi:hypothetical protein